jgi:hypothetical protein
LDLNPGAQSLYSKPNVPGHHTLNMRSKDIP